MGLVLNSILLTGDEDELVLFWNKEKVRRYQIPVNRGDIVGRKLILAGFDNRVRIYDVHSQTGIQKLHVFVGHVMNIYNMVVLDDGIFTTYSYDGTIRWWNIQVKACFSFFNVLFFKLSSKNISKMIKSSVLICLNFHLKKKNMLNLIEKDVHYCY